MSTARPWKDCNCIMTDTPAATGRGGSAGARRPQTHLPPATQTRRTQTRKVQR
jgi:hypothetical protein